MSRKRTLLLFSATLSIYAANLSQPSSKVLFFGCLIKQHFNNKYLENIQQSSVYLLIVQYLGGYILIQSVNARSNLNCSVLNIFDIYITLFLGQPKSALFCTHPFSYPPFSLLSFFLLLFFFRFFSLFSSFSVPSGSFCLTSFGLALSRGSFKTIDKIWHCSAVQ